MSGGGRGGPKGVDRRRLITGLACAVGAAGLARSAGANDSGGSNWLDGRFGAGAQATAPAPSAPVFQARTLTPPQFDQLRDTDPFVAGLRPHREGGMRLGLARPIETGDGLRHVIHNYGHGGAGMTLSFGAAEQVADLVQQLMLRHAMADLPPIAVLGAGVIGLTTAAAIKTRWPGATVTIYAATCDPAKTTSFKAGGMFAPVSTITEYHGGARRAELHRTIARSQARIGHLASTGLGTRLGLLRRQTYSFQSRGGNVRLSMGDAVRTAVAYETWLIDPTVLLPALRADLINQGVAFVTRHIETQNEVYALAQPIIVNCTGLGARDLFSDTALEGRRGHLVVLKNNAKLDYLINSWCGQGTRYLFARSNDIVIGGTQRRDETAPDFDPADPSDQRACDRILRSARSLFENGPIRCL